MPDQASKPAPPLAFLDGLRGLAALWVLLHHTRWLMWEGWESFRASGAHGKLETLAAYALAPLRYGHEAVIFFFVLSGFVIHLGHAKRLVAAPGEARLRYGDYVFRRVRRLYPPLVLALGVTALFDWLGASQGWSIYSGTTPYPLINTSLQPLAHDAGTLVGNLAFLMHGWVRCFGTNGPLWSLHFEWWFYMIYPLLWLLARRSAMVATGAVLALFAASWLVKSGPWLPVAQIFIALLTWWMGALLAEMYVGRVRVKWVWFAPLALLLPALPVLAPRLGLQGWAADTLYGLGFSGVFALCFLLRERGWRLRLLSALKPLGDMSYTLYIIHLPVLVFLGGWLMSRSPQGVLPGHFGWALVGSLLCLLLAWLAHFIVERPFTSRRA